MAQSIAESRSRLDRTCRALHKINKQAKKYADLAAKHYRNRKKATAHKNSLRKEALYSLKSDVLRRLLDRGDISTIELHDIDGREYYCFYVNGWSFHAPVDDWSYRSLMDQVDDRAPQELKNFQKDAESRVEMDLKEALTYFNDEEFGISANYYLEEKKVWYGNKSYFAGWSYLD